MCFGSANNTQSIARNIDTFGKAAGIGDERVRRGCELARLLSAGELLVCIAPVTWKVSIDFTSESGSLYSTLVLVFEGTCPCDAQVKKQPHT